jgi:hypothetical protein
MASMFKLKTWFWTIGLLFMQTFVLCVLWNILEPRPIYIHMLETFLPGFHWLTAGHFALGMAESFFYGAYFAVTFVLLHNFFHARHGEQSTPDQGKKAAA